MWAWVCVMGDKLYLCICVFVCLSISIGIDTHLYVLYVGRYMGVHVRARF